MNTHPRRSARLRIVKCTGPQCDREAEVGEHCQSHYMQARRNPDRPLRPLRGTVPYEPSQVVFRCPAELKEAAEKAAKKQGIDPAEWWRRAGKAALERT